MCLIFSMTLMSFSKFPPSLCAPTLTTALSGELKTAALVAMDAFLLQLLPFRPFAEVVLQQNLREFQHSFKHLKVIMPCFTLLMKNMIII